MKTGVDLRFDMTEVPKSRSELITFTLNIRKELKKNKQFIKKIVFGEEEVVLKDFVFGIPVYISTKKK